MSEYTPITGEMRDWFEHAYNYGTGDDIFKKVPDPWFGWKGTIEQMLDAIDAIHAQLERENAALKAELDRVLGEQDERRSCIYYDHERHYCSCHDIDTDALIEPPKDADKANICVGDKLDGYGKTIEVVELRYGRSGWVIVSRDGNAYADTYAFTHHHEPTVEDVLRKFAEGLGVPVADSYVAAAAAKLRLAGEAE